MHNFKTHTQKKYSIYITFNSKYIMNFDIVCKEIEITFLSVKQVLIVMQAIVVKGL